MDADKCAEKVDEGKKWKYTYKTETQRPVIGESTFATKTRTTERFASRHYDGSRKKEENPVMILIGSGREKKRDQENRSKEWI